MCVGKVKCWLRFESVVALGLGNSGAITWSEMADSEAIACAHLTLVKSATCMQIAICGWLERKSLDNVQDDLEEVQAKTKGTVEAITLGIKPSQA